MSWPHWLSFPSPQQSPESGGPANVHGGGGPQASPPSATTGAAIPVPGGGWASAHDRIVCHQEASTKTASPEGGCSPCSSRSKRKRNDDEEPAAVTRSSSAQSAHSAASARGVASVDSMMDVDDGLGTDVGPAASKKSREAGPEREESSPPQSYTRGKFRITRHNVVPGEQKGPSFSAGKRPPASRKDNRLLSRGPRQPGRASRRSSAPGAAGGGGFPHLALSRFSPGAGPSSSPGQGNSFSFGVQGAAAFFAAAADSEDDVRSSSTSNGGAAAPGGGSPVVVIDGSNAAFAYREGDGRWRAEGPLLAIQFFEDRGVEAVAFIPRQRLDNVGPQDDAYPAFQEARASGAISLVPAGGNDDLYFLKYAIDRNAPVVSNDRFRDHAANGDTLAALGRTRAELLDYLSEHQVSYTFARGEFVPNPEAQIVKELTRHASDKMASRSHEATRAPNRHASEPLPCRRGDERDSQTGPLPPLQAHEHHEGVYLLSEQRPP